MARAPSEFVQIHRLVDYYEPLLRAKVLRALRSLRSSLSLNDLIAVRQRGLSRAKMEKVLQPAAKVVWDATMRGGVLGAERVKKLG